MLSAHAMLMCVLLALASLASAQDWCTTTSCDTNVNCVGFANKLCFNTSNSNMTYNGSVCYSTSNCVNYTSASGDLTISLGGASPSLIYNYYGVIKTAVMNAYNTYCSTNNNFQICCPNSVSWPNKATEAATKTAMSTTDEVLIPSAVGSASQTTLIIRLAPNQASLLCNTVTYTTTATTTIATTTTTSSGNATTSTTTANTGTTTTGPTTTSGSTTTGPTTTSGSTTTGPTTTSGSTTTGPTTTSGSTTTGPTTTSGSTTTGPTTTSGSTTTGPTTTSGSTTTGPTTTSGSTTTGPTTTSGSTTTGPTTTSGSTTTRTSTAPPGRRRKREIALAAIRAESVGDESDLVLNRKARAAYVSISLPANTIAAIASSVSLTTVISTALSTSANITVTVTVTTVGSTSSSMACQVQSSRLVISGTALVALLAFSLRRST